MEVTAQGAVYLTSGLHITAQGEAEMKIHLPCGVYTVSATFDMVFGPEGLQTEIAVEVN